jgi:hypothetical protein
MHDLIGTLEEGSTGLAYLSDNYSDVLSARSRLIRLRHPAVRPNGTVLEADFSPSRGIPVRCSLVGATDETSRIHKAARRAVNVGLDHGRSRMDTADDCGLLDF